MDSEHVCEGRVELEVPTLEKFRAATGDYVPSLAEAFYNPHMEFCRDIGVAVAQVAAREMGSLRICDPLAGIGARGIRYAVEVGGVVSVVINDRSKVAQDFIRRNLQLNGMGARVEVFQRDASSLLFENRGRFNFVDLDPFGSPASFVEAACAALGKRGFLALTATDTAPLCGSYRRACVRRYGARSLRTEYCHELGIRILVGFVQRVAGKYELAFEPVLVHSTRHYFRIYLRGERKAARADEVLKRQGFVSHCFSCGRRLVVRGVVPELPRECECGGKFQHAGPLWVGRLGERGFVGEVLQEVARRGFRLSHQEVKLLELCREEAEGPATFYDVNELSRIFGRTPMSPRRVVRKLREEGYFASLTHFSPSGFRTDAPLERVAAACSGAGRL